MGRPTISIVEIDKRGIILGYYDTITEAAVALDLNKGFIVQNLNSQRKAVRSKGSKVAHYFRFATPEERANRAPILEWMQEKDQYRAEPINAPVAGLPEVAPEVIPTTWVKPTDEEEGLTAFDLLLKRRREILNSSQK